MKNTDCLLGITLAIALAPGARAGAADITAGFAPHVRPAAGGRIDWTAGHLLADGKGYGEGVGNQQKLLARRAAVLDAAANALAAAAGINVDANGRAGGMRNGRRRLEGVIKGYAVVAESWEPQGKRPTYRVTLRVPLWGVKSVASTFQLDCRKRLARQQSTHLPLVASDADTTDAVLIIDARGTDLQPCLFPEIVTDRGQTLIDVNMMPVNLATQQPLVRYVESDISFEQLHAAYVGPDGGASRVRLAAARGADDPPIHTKNPAADKPAEPQPNEATGADAPKKTRTRRRDRRAFKAVKTAGRNQSKIVLTAEDAEKLRADKTNVSLLRRAEVVVIVDSPAAGVQGAIDRCPGDDALAIAFAP